MPTRIVRLAGAAIAAALVGCFSTTAPGDVPALVGTYRLIAVDGSPLPARQGDTLTVRGAFTISSTSRYTLAESDSSATTGQVSDFSSSGIWLITSNAITLKDDDGRLYLGTLYGGTDTVVVRLDTHLSKYLREQPIDDALPPAAR